MARVSGHLVLALALTVSLFSAACEENKPHGIGEYPSVAVRGTVRDSASQSVLAGVTVWHDSFMVGETDYLGRYDVFDGMIPEGMMIYSKDGYQTDSLRLPEDFVRSETQRYVYYGDVWMVADGPS